MLWVLFGLMCLAAVAFSVWPLKNSLKGHGVLAAISIVVVVGLSAGIYAYKGRPGVPSGASNSQAAPDIQAMVDSLAARLEQEPDDLEGWKMLGRSYSTMGNSAAAVAAYERAVELSEGQDVGALVGLGEALLDTDGQAMSARSIGLFENALVLEPNNPPALFWGGIAAFNRGNQALAADRWELLLGTNPPAELRPMIEQRIAAWRGQPVAQPRPSPGPGNPPAPARGEPLVALSLSLGEAALPAMPDDAIVWIIARDPGQPMPPIAVTRRRLAELPIVIELGNADSMMPGRELSNFAEFEVVARVSVSGERTAQPGDWFGSSLVRPAESNSVEITINERIE